MADIKKINGYNIKDETARDSINNLATKEELANKVDKVEGKSLIADSEITRLANVDNYDDYEIRCLIANISTSGGSSGSNSNYGIQNVKDYGAVGTKDVNNASADTAAFLAAIATKSTVFVPEGYYYIDAKIVLYPWQQLILDKKAILDFDFSNDENAVCIEMGYQSVLKGGNIHVGNNFIGSVVAYRSDEANKLISDHWPFTGNKNDVQTRHVSYIKDININKMPVRPSSLDDIGGTAIELKATDAGAEGSEALWGVSIEDVCVNGAFDIALHAWAQDTDLEKWGPWLHDTNIVNFYCQYARKCFVLDWVNYVHIRGGAFQPQRLSDETEYAEAGMDIINCCTITLRDFSMWDTHAYKDGYEYKVYNTYGWCSDIEIHDIDISNYSSNDIQYRKFNYDDIRTLLSTRYYTSTGRYMFPEVLNYKKINGGNHEANSAYPQIETFENMLDYAIPIHPPLNTKNATASNKYCTQLGYCELEADASPEVYYFTIEEYNSDSISGYSTIYFSTDSSGVPSLARKIQCLGNAAPGAFPDYGYTYTINDEKTIIYLYRIYSNQYQDSYCYQRYLRIKNSFPFKTEIKVNVEPTGLLYALEETDNVRGTLLEKAYVGYCYFDETLGKPIWCKKAAVYNEQGNLVSSAVWVDAYGNNIDSP